MAADETVNGILSHRGTELVEERVVWGARTVPYTIRFSARARRLGMTISPQTGLVVTAPRGCVRELIERFVDRHERWVLRQTERLERTALRIPRRWPYGPTLPYLGEEHDVVVRRAEGRVMVRRAPERALVVHLRRPGIEGARRLLKRWYLSEALRWLTERIGSLGAQMGIAPRRIRVGDQRTRWGSCSRRGDISFNYRLVMAPLAIMDYVVQHELLHRRQPNHSRQFWALMAAHDPAYRDAIGWLKTYGPYLTV